MGHQSKNNLFVLLDKLIAPPISGRRILLASRLNATVLLTMLIITIINISINVEAIYSVGTHRLIWILLICILNIFLLKANRIKLFKVILIYLPVFLLFCLPTFMGFVENGSYSYYQISIVAFSVFPALILSHSTEKWLLYVSLAYYFILILFIDNLLTWFTPEPLSIYEVIRSFYLYYKLIPIIIFIVFQGSIYYLRRLNNINEQKLLLTNKKFEEKNEELRIRNERIELQRELITRQKKDLTDSITYAKYIQSGLLPSGKIMNYLFPNHFILNLPRDIVSGDFYWVAKQKDEITIVLADCMGHGVPGAFISILGMSILNEVLNSNADLPTGTFMNEVREHVMISLNQTGTKDDMKVGMDMSLLKINKKTNHVSFTGANQNLYYFNKGKFNEIKGDRMPVGVQIGRNHSFTTNEFKLEKGDSIYMLSDGYPDQFGGEKGKKFGYPRFKKLLETMETKPLDEQKERLKSELTTWQANLDQIDDILVIGIKI